MKIKIFYQDFKKNAFLMLSNKPYFEPEKAVMVSEIDLSDEGLQEWARIMGVKLDEDVPHDILSDVIFSKMNHLEVPIGHPDRETFERAGHTSMSVGDYVEFEDGDILFCSPQGWLRQKGKNKHWLCEDVISIF